MYIVGSCALLHGAAPTLGGAHERNREKHRISTRRSTRSTLNGISSITSRTNGLTKPIRRTLTNIRVLKRHTQRKRTSKTRRTIRRTQHADAGVCSLSNRADFAAHRAYAAESAQEGADM